jgi:adenylate cyclase
VPVLNDYMAMMTPLIRKHNGFLNKLLGDGMMFFYAAPRDNPEHALDALRTVFEMKRKEGPFNQSLIERGLPPLTMRVGIGSGHITVGNCGPSDGSFNDYTVLGDVVNSTSRLEGANKVFGSGILVNARAFQLLRLRVLLRPIGNIQVKGKQEGVMAYEPLALIEDATPEQQRLAELTEAVVNSFMNGQFADCLEAVATMEEAVGESKLTHLYHELAAQYLKEPPESFNGQIVLTEK